MKGLKGEEREHSVEVLEKLKVVEGLLKDIKGAPIQKQSAFTQLEAFFASKLALVILVPVFTALLTLVVNSFSHRDAISLVQLQDEIKKASLNQEDDRTRKLKEFESKLDIAKQESLERFRKSLEDERKKDETAKVDKEKKETQKLRRLAIATEIDLRLASKTRDIHSYGDPKKRFFVTDVTWNNQPRPTARKEVRDAIAPVIGLKQFQHINYEWRNHTLVALFAELLETASPEDQKSIISSIHSIFSYALKVERAGERDIDHVQEWVRGVCKHWVAYRTYLGAETIIDFGHLSLPDNLKSVCEVNLD